MATKLAREFKELAWRSPVGDFMHTFYRKMDVFFHFGKKLAFSHYLGGHQFLLATYFWHRIPSFECIPTVISMIIELLLVPSSDALEAVPGVCLDLPGQPQPPHHAELLLHRAAHRLALAPLHKLHNCTHVKITEVSNLGLGLDIIYPFSSSAEVLRLPAAAEAGRGCHAYLLAPCPRPSPGSCPRSTGRCCN